MPKRMQKPGVRDFRLFVWRIAEVKPYKFRKSKPDA